MLHNKLHVHGNWSTGSGEEEFLKSFYHTLVM